MKPSYIIYAILFFSLIACKSKKYNDFGNEILEDNISYLQPNEPGCKGAVLNLVLSSKKVQDLLSSIDETVKKNDGTGHGFVLDGSPHPQSDGITKQSEKYEFSVHEIYPDMHSVVAQFSYNPVKKELYQFGPLNNVNTIIDYDTSFLRKIDEACH
ncbi:MAG: hypothetical protein IPL97_13095 [Niastella sp.]|nr:hypothetical protein [Niastella sp.]